MIGVVVMVGDVIVMRCHSSSPADRTEEDQVFIYEELQNVRAFGHLSNAVSQGGCHGDDVMEGWGIAFSLWNRSRRRWLHVSSWNVTLRLGSIVSVSLHNPPPC